MQASRNPLQSYEDLLNAGFPAGHVRLELQRHKAALEALIPNENMTEDEIARHVELVDQTHTRLLLVTD